ncbi:helix-turn-helix transcriptional regulator [Prauserella halophila]|uniref:Helix-turn-helix transcriptional regulator n=1 Tax=Prauserella halophila TaxID=185641 RepID=A0ABP4GVU4_9PSEU|nr:helix-turn-helix transcriptional regulator [Prauserella halophila]MCP2236299.1 Transcriptional regulator, contains XRE-family HTH domain [Prauserella halophila]
MSDDDTTHIGRRIREVRAWRGMSIRAAAELAGLTHGYLAQIERGEKPVSMRQTLEGVARALRVAPTELTGLPWTMSGVQTSEPHAAVSAVEDALAEVELGERPEGVDPRPFPALAQDVDRLANELHQSGDYAAQGELLPPLLYELHAAYVDQPARRRDVLLALMDTYHRATLMTKNLGIRGLPSLAAHHARRVADELDAPVWHAMAVYLRTLAAGSAGRARQHTLAVRAADELRPQLDNSDAAQVYGMLQLHAALAMASQGRGDETRDHLAEAETLAGRMDAEVGDFGGLYFGRANVGVWRVSLHTELGEGGRVAELARGVHAEALPSRVRRAMYHADLGRALAGQRATREQSIDALVTAEQIAPQRIRNNLLVRETVSDLLSRARRDAGGRELRGLAWRMGVAPVG